MTQQEIDQLVATPATAEEQNALFAMEGESQWQDNETTVRDKVTGRILKHETAAGDDGSDSELNVSFTLEPVLHKLATKRAGKPTYIEMEFITIIPPGEGFTTVHAPVSEFHKWRFPVEYAAFKAGIEQVQVGTPLGMWAILQPSEIREMQSRGIRTVEQLANLSDTNAGSMRGFYRLKERAKQYLDELANKGSSGVLQMELEEVKREAEAEKQAAKAELDAVRAQMAEMMKLLQATRAGDSEEEATPKKKYGAK